MLERMRDTLAHRGPDDRGLFVEEGIGLGHRRLSIVDLAGGHQPMANDDGSLQIVYNGEVYNHLDIRAELERRGQTYRTHSDTETVLRLYDVDGSRSPERLRGMFAYAIWNRRTRELFLARDRLGIKPLYYAHADDGTLFFASEIKALLEAGAIRPSINLAALPDYLANHAPSGDETLFAGVYRLPAGHTLLWREGKIHTSRYWDLDFTSSAPSATDADLIAQYREYFREAVRLRLMADVPLGMFLSGGIDSAAITAMMSTLVEEPIKTFSVALAEREANELHYARLAAQRFGTDHREVVVSPAEFFEALPSLVWHEDEPIAHPSSVALHFVSRLASQHVKVVLTGEGSDETLAGYGRYSKTLYMLLAGGRYERTVPRGLRRLIQRGIEGLPSTSTLSRRLRRTFLCLPATLDGLYFDNFAVFPQSTQRRLFAPAVRTQLQGIDPYATMHGCLEAGDAETLLDRLLYVDSKTYLHELLMKQDQMSMAASIESRVPFLDHHLVEFAAKLPQRLKLRGFKTKVVLRKAMRGFLPPEILTRPKMGFPVPVGRWLRGPFRHVLDEYVTSERALSRNIFEANTIKHLVSEHLRGVPGHDERLWSLANFEIWQRIFLDGETPQPTRLREDPSARARV
jgi:asparagine synthase (glutamine-hydrolysing)